LETMHSIISECDLVILTGGYSKRMRYVFKGNLQIEGETFINRLLKNLAPCFRRSFLIGSPSELTRYRRCDNLIISEDHYAGIGPLAGIMTAFELTDSEYVFLSPCDTPFMTRKVIDELYRVVTEYRSEITIPVSNDRFYPLIGFYKRTVYSHIKTLIERDRYAIRFLFRLCQTAIVHFSNASPFENINTWEDYERITGIDGTLNKSG
jgi:molybdopterin-guanine dinucleotide biosynthesis protein A